MFDWDEVFRVARIVFVASLSVAILTWASSLGKGFLDDIIATPGYEGLGNFLRAYMRVDQYFAVASTIIAVPSYIFYRVARGRRWRM